MPQSGGVLFLKDRSLGQSPGNEQPLNSLSGFAGGNAKKRNHIGAIVSVKSATKM